MQQHEEIPDEPLDLPPYEVIEKLGEGTYGKVFKCRNLTTNEIVAVKKASVHEDEEQNGIPSTTLREMSILNKLKGVKGIVQLKETILTSNFKYYLVFEYIDQDLRTFLEANKHALNPTLIQKILFQILKALSICHGSKIFHRDLKPANILIQHDGIIKLADFGLAKYFGHPVYRTHTKEVQTLWYRCPEILMGNFNYTSQVDIFSVGCIFGEMLTGSRMFSGSSEIDQIFKIFQYMGTPEEHTWLGITNLPYYSPKFPKFKGNRMPHSIATDLLHKMLELDPKRRITAIEALRHPYFDSISVQDRIL